jgi:hypothetical protein
LVRILSHINGKKALNLRLVSSRWRDIVDRYCQLGVKIDDQNHTGFPIIPHFRNVKHCQVINAVGVLQHGFINPGCLTSLSLSGKIPPQNIRTITHECVNIVTLSLTGDFLDQGRDLFNNINLSQFLRPITTLSLLSLNINEMDDGVNNLIDIFDRPIPNLLNFTIQLCDLQEDLERLVLDFLHKCHKLQYLDLSLSASPDTTPGYYSISPFSAWYPGVRCCTSTPQLRTLKFKCDEYFNFVSWCPFLGSQLHLQNLSLKEESIKDWDWQSMSLMTSNKRHLRYIDLDVPTDCHLSLSFFKDMPKLRTLKIYGISSPHDDGAVTDFSRLPHGLRHLVINNMVIDNKT